MKTLSFLTRAAILLTLSMLMVSCGSKKKTGEKFNYSKQHHGPQFKYNELMIKDYDEMSQMVNSQLKKARSVGSNTSDDNVDDPEAVAHLREALKLMFSRPDSDNMIAKIMPEVRKELIGYNAFESTVSSITDEAIGVTQNENAPVIAQATGIFMLENILSHLRPEASSNPEMRTIIERVKAADVSISSDVRKDMKLRGMFKTRNPSELAADILKASPLPTEKKKKK